MLKYSRITVLWYYRHMSNHIQPKACLLSVRPSYDRTALQLDCKADSTMKDSKYSRLFRFILVHSPKEGSIGPIFCLAPIKPIFSSYCTLYAKHHVHLMDELQIEIFLFIILLPTFFPVHHPRPLKYGYQVCSKEYYLLKSTSSQRKSQADHKS